MGQSESDDIFVSELKAKKLMITCFVPPYSFCPTPPYQSQQRKESKMYFVQKDVNIRIKPLNLQIMIGFSSGLKFINVKKQYRELKILTSTYKGSYQLMVNIFASKYIRI